MSFKFTSVRILKEGPKKLNYGKTSFGWLQRINTKAYECMFVFVCVFKGVGSRK